MACAFVLIDGLGADGATALTSIQKDVAVGKCRQWAVTAADPTLSRPNYATLLTGRNPDSHQILENGDARRLPDGHLFDRLERLGLRSALVGYHWWRDLTGREGTDWRYYDNDWTSDAWVFAQAAELATASPDLLVVHPMGVDLAGHCFGGGSPQYLAAVTALDHLIAQFAATWFRRSHGRNPLLIGSDHGMGEDGLHGRPTDRERQVTYFAYAPAWTAPITEQRQVAGLLYCLATGGTAFSQEEAKA